MSKIKKITAVNMAVVILVMSLTACGGSDTEDVVNKPDSADTSEITENKTEIEADITENTAPDTPDEPITEPETCEDYLKLANTYLQMDDVIQALAVLDEGIEKFAVGE